MAQPPPDRLHAGFQSFRSRRVSVIRTRAVNRKVLKFRAPWQGRTAPVPGPPRKARGRLARRPPKVPGSADAPLESKGRLSRAAHQHRYGPHTPMTSRRAIASPAVAGGLSRPANSSLPLPEDSRYPISMSSRRPSTPCCPRAASLRYTEGNRKLTHLLPPGFEFPCRIVGRMAFHDSPDSRR